MLQEIIRFLSNNIIVTIAICIGIVTMTHYVLAFIRGLHRDRLFEQSRREVAAYVAEGSITPEAALKILAMRPTPDDDDKEEESGEDPAMKLAGAVGWETLDSKDAAKLVEARATMNDKAWGQAVNLTLEGMAVADAISLARSRSGPAGSGSPTPVPA